jgi:hypothetical protein
MTTLAPPPVPLRSPEQSGDRFVGIHANLMPEEVLAGRRLHALKRKLALGLVSLVALLLAGYGLSWVQTESSQSDLHNEQGRAGTLAKTMQTYQPLMAAQAKATGIVSTLSTIMAGDLQWQGLIGSLAKVAPSGTQLTAFSASVGPATTTTGIGVLNQTGEAAVGQLTLTGTATDKNAVAAFVDKLTTVPGIASPFVTSVTGAKGSLTFSISALITSKALGGRFTATTGGK